MRTGERECESKSERESERERARSSQCGCHSAGVCLVFDDRQTEDSATRLLSILHTWSGFSCSRAG